VKVSDVRNRYLCQTLAPVAAPA